MVLVDIFPMVSCMILMQIASDHITMASDGKIQLCGLIFSRAHHLLLLAPHLNEVRVLHLLATTGLAVGKSFAGNSQKPWVFTTKFGYDRGSTCKVSRNQGKNLEIGCFLVCRGGPSQYSVDNKLLGIQGTKWWVSPRPAGFSRNKANS